MAYNKDSGESRLRKDANPNTYINKKNKSIFKNAQSTQTSLPKPQSKTTFDWEIPTVDLDINIPNITEFELPEKEIPKPVNERLRYEKKEPQSFYEHERQRKEKSTTEPKQEMLSFMNIIWIIALNGFVPIIGGFVYYIIFASRGEKQKAAQSVVLSAIASIIRILFIINS